MKRHTNRPANPIAARVAPPVGQALPDGWDRSAAAGAGGTYDRRNWQEVFNSPKWSGKATGATENIIQGARLSK